MGLQWRNSERRLHHVRSQVAPGYFVQLVHIVNGLWKEWNCTIRMWMPWQSCTGTCGSQIQIRQRQLCCPEAVLEKTELNCLQACQMDISTTKLNESRPCVLCKNGSLSSFNSCHCDAKSKGLCCEGIFKMISLSLFLSLLHLFSLFFWLEHDADFYLIWSNWW